MSMVNAIMNRNDVNRIENRFLTRLTQIAPGLQVNAKSNYDFIDNEHHHSHSPCKMK